jgi:hypothetical protein
VSNKKLLILIAIFLLIVAIVGGALYFQFSNAKQIVTEFRHHIFCEQLSKGMSPSEVREELSHYGYFIETQSNFQGGLFVMGVSFTDPDMKRQIGDQSITLVFQDLQYINARIPVPLSDSHRSLCP